MTFGRGDLSVCPLGGCFGIGTNIGAKTPITLITSITLSIAIIITIIITTISIVITIIIIIIIIIVSICCLPFWQGLPLAGTDARRGKDVCSHGFGQGGQIRLLVLMAG